VVIDRHLSATEIVRRAERGIGVAIRRGQESGEVGSHGGKRIAARLQRAKAESDLSRANVIRGSAGELVGFVDELLGALE